jgi:hypothetical protein
VYVLRRASIEFPDGTAAGKQFKEDRALEWLQLDSPEVTTTVHIEIRDAYPPDDPQGDEEPVEETAI